MKLIIVESRTKAKTITNFFKDEFTVIATDGHLFSITKNAKELQKTKLRLGINFDDATPIYQIDYGKNTKWKEILKEIKQATKIFLATDPDREGEAISAHIYRNIDKKYQSICSRIVFHEITQKAITEGIANAHGINWSLVDSQTARRMVDRLIGFRLSTLFIQKVRCPSVGRVQSAVLEWIYDREWEIHKFIPINYFLVSGTTDIGEINLKKLFGETPKYFDKKLISKYNFSAIKMLKIANIKQITKSWLPPKPLTTSSLLRLAANKLNFSLNQTSLLAQKLYEGISINGNQQALITYIRTDSYFLNPDFVKEAKLHIASHFKHVNVVDKISQQKKQKYAQEAHEAIRPIDINFEPISNKDLFSDENLYNLYKLIYAYTLASLCTNATTNHQTIYLQTKDDQAVFTCSKTTVTNPQWRSVLKKYQFNDYLENNQFIDCKIGDKVNVNKIDILAKQTDPPGRYSPSTIVKKMEDSGIGRPSTYGSTIKMLVKNKYVNNFSSRLFITYSGQLCAVILKTFWNDTINEKTTSTLEKNLDTIAENNLDKKDFFMSVFNHIEEKRLSVKNEIPTVYYLPTTILCDTCKKGTYTIIFHRARGSFIGCSNRECKSYLWLNALKEQQTPIFSQFIIWDNDYPKVIS